MLKVGIYMDKYSFFTSKELRPTGWLRRQIEIQAEGLCGNLDKVWPDVRDSAWIGGSREGWERVPYWLDGFIPMAYILDSDDMKTRALKYIDKIIENQQEDGWICPNGNVPRKHYDTWAICLITKVLTVYYQCSADERVPEVIRKTLKNYYELLSSGEIKLFNWGKYRWFECFVAIRFIKERYPEDTWVDSLAKMLYEQGTKYETLTELWKEPSNRWSFDTHIVNLCMMLKSEAISCEMLGKSYTGLAEKLDAILKKYNGTVTGIYTGDECLSGNSPIQGTELCAVVELMYSCEWLYAVTGDTKWAELLELQAFNALPATFTDDMWAHQYVQLTNQTDASPFGGNPIFGTNDQFAHTFGLEPHFGCCTSNFGQGWPKLALSTFMKASDGIVSAVPLASTVNFKYKGADIEVALETDYPFENSFVYRVKCAKKTSAKLRVRIPSFAKNLIVNGESAAKKNMLIFGGFEAGETVITLSYDVEIGFLSRPRGLHAARAGSVIFSLPIEFESRKIEYTRSGVERKFPYCDYYFMSTAPWNFGFASDRLELVTANERDGYPFSSKNPPIKLVADLAPIEWRTEPRFDRICAKIPKSNKAIGESRKFELYPFGCSKLRITEMPQIKQDKN